jgi:hypothetical protein
MKQLAASKPNPRPALYFRNLNFNASNPATACRSTSGGRVALFTANSDP